MTEERCPSRKWPLAVHACAAIWVLQVLFLVVFVRHWNVLAVILPLSLPPFVIGRQTVLDALRGSK